MIRVHVDVDICNYTYSIPNINKPIIEELDESSHQHKLNISELSESLNIAIASVIYSDVNGW